ncbi:hypothetical protein V6N11_058266 [Hibiscus sabdariffa]|uniref:Uncharacterized protein n=1 Tax=Hibiscus sabdariffa TaxID=183260 RepID=A0ABR2A2P2_9ROSI
MSISPKLSSVGSGVIGQLNGRPPDDIDQVGTPRMLERVASPADPVDVRNPKKAKGGISPNDLGDEVCAMEADGAHDSALLGHDPTLNVGHGLVVNDGTSEVGQGFKDSSGVSEPRRVASYAKATTSGLNREGWFANEQSLNTDEVVVLDEDCIILEDGDFPTIKFSERNVRNPGIVDTSTTEVRMEEEIYIDDQSNKYGPWMVAKPQRRSIRCPEVRGKSTGAANLDTGSCFMILREDDLEPDASRMTDGLADVDGYGNTTNLGIMTSPKG